MCGELDLYTAQRLHNALDKAIEVGTARLTVELTQVGFLDSTALGVLIATAKRLSPAGGILDIVCPNDKIRRVFELAGLDVVFAIYSSRDGTPSKSVTP